MAAAKPSRTATIISRVPVLIIVAWMVAMVAVNFLVNMCGSYAEREDG